VLWALFRSSHNQDLCSPTHEHYETHVFTNWLVEYSWSPVGSTSSNYSAGSWWCIWILSWLWIMELHRHQRGIWTERPSSGTQAEKLSTKGPSLVIHWNTGLLQHRFTDSNTETTMGRNTAGCNVAQWENTSKPCLSMWFVKSCREIWRAFIEWGIKGVAVSRAIVWRKDRTTRSTRVRIGFIGEKKEGAEGQKNVSPLFECMGMYTQVRMWWKKHRSSFKYFPSFWPS